MTIEAPLFTSGTSFHILNEDGRVIVQFGETLPTYHHLSDDTLDFLRQIEEAHVQARLASLQTPQKVPKAQSLIVESFCALLRFQSINESRAGVNFNRGLSGMQCQG